MFTILFDIDGTLINTGGAGMHAMSRALANEFAIDQPADVPVMGRTDRGIIGDLFSKHDIDDSHANWERFRLAYLAELPDALRRLRATF